MDSIHDTLKRSTVKLALGIDKLKPLIDSHGNLVDALCYEQGLVTPHKKLQGLLKEGQPRNLQLDVFMILTEMNVPFARLYDLVQTCGDKVHVAILQRGMSEPMSALGTVFDEGFERYSTAYYAAIEAKKVPWSIRP